MTRHIHDVDSLVAALETPLGGDIELEAGVYTLPRTVPLVGGGLHLRGKGAKIIGNETLFWMTGGTFVFEDLELVKLHGSQGYAVEMQAGSLALHRCLVRTDHNAHAATAYGVHSSLELFDCKVVGGRWGTLWVTDGAALHAERCTMVRGVAASVLASMGGVATLVDCEIRDCLEGAVLAGEDGRVTVRGGRIHNCGLHGVVAVATGVAQVEGTTLENLDGCALIADSGGTVRARGCTVVGVTRNTDGTLELDQCDVRDEEPPVFAAAADGGVHVDSVRALKAALASDDITQVQLAPGEYALVDKVVVRSPTALRGPARLTTSTRLSFFSDVELHGVDIHHEVGDDGFTLEVGGGHCLAVGCCLTSDQGTRTAVVHGEGSRLELRGCTVETKDGDGVWVTNGGSLQMDGGGVGPTKKCGIAVSAGGSAILRDATVLDAGTVGIVVRAGSALEMHGGHIEGPGDCAVYADGEGAQVNLHGVAVNGAAAEGLAAANSGRIEAIGGQIAGCAKPSSVESGGHLLARKCAFDSPPENKGGTLEVSE